MSTAGDESLVRLTVHFSGNVQGVGFRYTARQAASGFNIGGYVRNLPDGRVELVVEGPRSQVEGSVAAIQKAMQGYIHETKKAESPGTGEFTGFEIRH